MFKSASHQIIKCLIENDALSNEDIEICEYGIQQGFIIILNILTTILIGCLFDLIIESFIALAVFIPLRSYAGGFHFDNPIICYIVSSFLVLTQLICVKYICLQNSISIISVFSSILIFILAPVASQNKPLDEPDTDKNRSIIKKILFVMEFFLHVFLFCGFFSIGRSILFSFLQLILLLLIGISKPVIVNNSSVKK